LVARGLLRAPRSTRPSRSAQRKRVDDKSRRGQTKAARAPVRRDD
jgi:hypothetical protein